MFLSATTSNARLPFWLTVAIIFSLWVVYTVIYTLSPDKGLGMIAELTPGILAVFTLSKAGFRDDEWYLRPAPISKQGLTILGIVCLLLLPPLLAMAGAGQNGVSWFMTLLYAPASGIAQELYFRGALLPVSIKLANDNRGYGVIVQALFFSLWHVPRAYLTSPITPWVGTVVVALITFLGGVGWGWQVQRDRTIVWALSQHVVFLMILSLFGL